MVYTVENEAVRLSAEDRGAQLASLVLKETGREYLWQGSRQYWPERAINLFPICGRLWGGKYELGGREYRMDIHGFAKDSAFTLAEKGEGTLAFELTQSEETLAAYPFRFLLRVEYALRGSEAIVRYTVRTTGDGEMIYTLGGHPGFNVPIDPAGKFEDCTLTFGAPCRARKLRIGNTGYMLGGTEAWDLPDGRSVRLDHAMFDEDAVFLTGMPDSVTLRQGTDGPFVTVSYPGMPYLGLWHTPRTQAPFLCIEPWAGLPSDEGAVDDLAVKRSMQRLLPGGESTCGYSIRIG